MKDLTEGEVIAAVVAYLQGTGWTVSQVLKETQMGTDIIAQQGVLGPEMRIEAKGATSSKFRSRRYGLPFSAGQIGQHVARAVYRALCDRGPGCRGGIALPDTDNHRKYVAAMHGHVGITVYWVDQDSNVRYEKI